MKLVRQTTHISTGIIDSICNSLRLCFVIVMLCIMFESNSNSSQITQKADIEIQTYFFPEEDIDQLAEDLLADAYRIVQELINNILKHAQASQVDVQLTKHTDHLNIFISDNGKGFQKSKTNGIGLRNIKDRLQKVKGTLDIDSSPGHGTSITVDIPLN